jgi:hypothetical protein
MEHVTDLSDLAEQFTQYYQNRQRIIVRTRYGETLRGYVGRTTGWKPVYILLAKANSSGSSEILTPADTITGTINCYR